MLGQTSDPQSYLGRVMGFPKAGGEDWADKSPAGTQFEFTHTVEQELIDAVMTGVNFVRNLKDTLGPDVEMFIEVSVPIGHITGEEGATGSSDVILVVPSQKLIVCADFKFGKAPVYAYDVIEPESVDPISGETTPPVRQINLQAGMYVLGSMEWLGPLYEFERAKAIIVQPALGKVSEYEADMAELHRLCEFLSSKSREADENPTFVPNSDNCFFCRARFDCHARNAEVLKTAVEGFEDADEFAQAKVVPIFLPKLGQLYGKLDMIEQWCKDMREETLRQLQAGNVLVGTDGKPMKLVEGRKPHRTWADEAVAQKQMEDFRLQKVMWKQSLITPADAEKLAQKERKKRGSDESPEKKPIGVGQWAKLSELVTQGKGKPTPALGTDPRPAIVNETQGMEDEDYDLFN